MAGHDLSSALLAAQGGQRLSPEQGLALLQEADLLTLGKLAGASRWQHNPQRAVTFVVDRNINTTNACTSGCGFCAFFRPPGHPEAYVLDRDQLGRKIDETLALGGKQILIQGGLHPDIGVHATCELFRWIKQHHPIHIHGLSPPRGGAYGGSGPHGYWPGLR